MNQSIVTILPSYGLMNAAEFMGAVEIHHLRCTGASHFDDTFMESAAEAAVRERPLMEQERAPRDSNQSWLRILAEIDARIQRPLVFTAAPAWSDLKVFESACDESGRRLRLMSTDTSHPFATCEPDGEAVGCPAMRSGVHYAEIEIVRQGHGHTFGLVRPGEAGVEMHIRFHAGNGFVKQPDRSQTNRWPSLTLGADMDYRLRRAEEGDTVGLLLDYRRGSVCLFKNRKWVGMIVPEGVAGELSWAAGMVIAGDELRISKADPWAVISEAEYEQNIAAEWTSEMYDAFPRLCAAEGRYSDWMCEHESAGTFDWVSGQYEANMTPAHREEHAALSKIFPPIRYP